MSPVFDVERVGARLKAFNGEQSEWPAWKGKFKAVLNSADLLGGLLSDTERRNLEAASTRRVTRSTTATEDEGEVKETEPVSIDWEAISSKIHSKLVLYTEGTAYDMVMQFEGPPMDGRAAWQALEDKFEYKGTARMAALHGEMMQCVMGDHEDPDKFFMRIEHIQRQLASLGDSVSDSMMMGICMAKLPSRYVPVRTVMDAVEGINYAGFKQRVRAFYQREIIRQPEQENVALIAKFKGNCYGCGKYGHRQAQCRSGDNGHKGIICYECGKRGHITRNCPNKEEEAEQARLMMEVDVAL